ncbi:MAG: hypothetical protein COW00_01150 [Bdellovibrio sp. CG12_big_fil_rev_8_21_14_0_65_39_13]|nr:MAG: hypothetical protein COW78_10445 [Bdellovibrio sp. CG22_combo_CG10-13_8_21_14_all_39_27]PIQ62759.1 MAG: hypothetical protein COW00_01150 [Bdellovibrio sp. CG12_big_fil_rev_8_21_14_0_65_39_13]PIR36081.1 MAG: hypothetical protein COV37_05370 [Bdellovibrio sp. CG11_big_fil_rev_8_21_14_0_20_39_38]PJB53705.1 MAG: hypothetical protein CO099_05705 [Bdellovibrio sp. CG_4_9_14_3_um_filter_39_7]
MKTALITLAILINSGAYAAQTSSSDVIKYALTSHGIKYLLRDKRGSVNAWKTTDKFTNIPANGSSVPAKRWGNTDCSGLVSAAIRYNGYYAPEKRGKPALSTALFAQLASKKKNGFYFEATGTKMIDSVRHGDFLNRSGSPYGHVFFFNGSDSRNMMNTVEARCTKCGVGAFVKSWNDVLKTNYKLIRNKNIVNNVGNKKKVFSLAEASAKKSTSNKSIIEKETLNEHIVRPGDTLKSIAMEYGVEINAIKDVNPDINFSRLKVGDQIMVNM